jgi:hypothetical protein
MFISLWNISNVIILSACLWKLESVRTSAWFTAGLFEILWMGQSSTGKSLLTDMIVTSVSTEFRTIRQSPFSLWLWFYLQLAPLAWGNVPSPRVTPWDIVYMTTCTLGQRLFIMKTFHSSGGEVQAQRSCYNRLICRSVINVPSWAFWQ